jgi:hypothetical protein
MRWTTVFPPQHAIHVRHWRRRDLKNWRVEGLVSIISESLELGLILFFIGLVVLAWRTNPTIACVTTVITGIMISNIVIIFSLPAYIPSCPYRTSFAAVIPAYQDLFMSILDIAFKFSAVVGVDYDQNLKWITSTFLANQYLENTEISDGDWLRQAVAGDWLKIDRILRIPRGFDQSLKDRLASLSWLVGNRTVPEDLISECLSDLPGSPIYRSKRELEQDKKWVPNTDEERQRQQFAVYYQALLSLLHSEGLNEGTDKISEPEKLLAAMLSDKTEDTPSPSYTTASIDSLSKAIRRVDEQSQNVLSKYFLGLAEDLFGSQQFLSQDTEFDLVESLLPILTLLWYHSDYHRAQIHGNAEKIVGFNPAAQSFHWLQDVFNKLSMRSEEISSHNFQARYNSILEHLATMSFFDVLACTNPSGMEF